MSRTPLTSRPMDLFYFSFFLMHILATVVVDLQAIYPTYIVPEFMKAIVDHYLTTYNDPLIGSVMGFFGKARADTFVWFRTFIFMEAFFQLPVFLLGMRGLWKGSRSVYVLLLAYAASATTTTLPCVTTILATPLTSAGTAAANIVSVTTAQRASLLTSFIPFLVVPLIMTVDMGFRVVKLVRAGDDALTAAKRK